MIKVECDEIGTYILVARIKRRGLGWVNPQGDRVYVKDGDILRPVMNCSWFNLYKRKE